MFTKKFLAGAALALALPLSAAPSAKRGEAQGFASVAATSNNAFGLKLFSQVKKTTKAGNKFLSPVSMYLALSMLENGAQGETDAELRKVLEWGTASRAQSNANNLALLKALNGRKDLVLKIANSIWSRKGFPLLTAFVERLQGSYGAKATALDFGSADASKTINQWVSDATEKKIDSIVPDQIPDETVLYLINAAYFDAEWEHQFAEFRTHLQTFHAPAGDVKVAMVSSERTSFRSLDLRGMTAVELPYKGGKVSMVVMLPQGGQSVEQLASGLNAQTWSDLTTELDKQYPRGLLVTMPKLQFSYDSEESLNEVLKAAGMPRAFDQQRAQLKGISDAAGNLYVSNVKHKTFLQVDEFGTKAAAATSVEVGLESAFFGKQLVIDRPYLLAIRDHATNAILFLGTVKSPEGGVLPKPRRR